MQWKQVSMRKSAAASVLQAQSAAFVSSPQLDFIALVIKGKTIGFDKVIKLFEYLVANKISLTMTTRRSTVQRNWICLMAIIRAWTSQYLETATTGDKDGIAGLAYGSGALEDGIKVLERPVSAQSTVVSTPQLDSMPLSPRASRLGLKIVKLIDDLVPTLKPEQLDDNKKETIGELEEVNLRSASPLWLMRLVPWKMASRPLNNQWPNRLGNAMRKVRVLKNATLLSAIHFCWHGHIFNVMSRNSCAHGPSWRHVPSHIECDIETHGCLQQCCVIRRNHMFAGISECSSQFCTIH